MKKLLILFLLLGFVCISYSDKINVRVIINSIDIISPDGEMKTYTNPENIDFIEYSSKVIANGMSILNYYSVGVILKNKQGLFISKDPLTGAFIFSKIENSKSGPIVITFDATTIAQLSADTIFSLKYNEDENSITMKIIDGNSILKMNEEEIELVSNETFKYKIKGDRNAI